VDTSLERDFSLEASVRDVTIGQLIVDILTRADRA